ncbi:galaxin-2 isoform X2 [Nematostella vectensis]|uniref:galaxin-2 isoform X2 n=1 Tax=Nematostella vectensis TaxID=45351 RepID=UPI00139013FA|nr:galaxin-2 isoform X2 [Nematostella vectensis]XP_032229621.1 galaxin-2 isoform X2 [Nematostella vectensis]
MWAYSPSKVFILSGFFLFCALTTEVQSRGDRKNRDIIRADRQRRSLCDNDFYDSNFYICCDGYISWKPSNDAQCCRHRAYNPNTYLCCGGYVSWMGNTNTACCGQRSYNPRDYDCCGGNLIRRDGDSATGCCRGTAYDPRYFTCCQGHLTWRSDSGSCCGGRFYDTQDDTARKGF